MKVAEALFYNEGTRAVGVDRVIAEAKIAKATLYRHFPTKEDLVIAYLSARDERTIVALQEYLSAEEVGAAEQALRLFDFLFKRVLQGGFRGCAFMLAVAENENSERIRGIAAKHKTSIRLLLQNRAEQLTTEPEKLAEELALCYEGALASIAVFRQSHAAVVARRVAETVIEAYVARYPLPAIS